jgi:hypothetical protein
MLFSELFLFNNMKKINAKKTEHQLNDDIFFENPIPI